MSTIKAINIQHPSSPNTNIVMDASGNMTVAGSIAGGTASSGIRNRIINGDFKVWQRGTSFSAAGYTADRWTVDQTGTWARSTDVPSTSFQYSMSCSATVAGGGSYTTIRQRIESVNSYDLAGKKVTLSFWVKNTSGSTSMYAGFDYPNATDNWSGWGTSETFGFTAPYNTWTKITYTSSALNAGVSGGLQITIYAADASNTRTFLITGVQLEEGTVATAFERRPIGMELSLCQRYFEMSYPQGVAIGTATAQGSYAFGTPYSTVGYQVGYGATIPFKVTKRVTNPTVTFYSLSGTATKLSTSSSLGTELATNSAFPINASDSAVSLINWSGGTVTVLNNVFGVHYIVTAEL